MTRAVGNNKTGRSIVAASAVVFVYFFMMFFISSYRNTYVFIGVLIEMFTIPMLLTWVLSMVLLLVQLIKQKRFSFYMLCCLLLQLAVPVLLMIQSEK